MSANTVTRSDLCEAVYRKSSVSRAEAVALVEQVLNEIAEAIERGETVMLTSFGTFKVRRKAQRIGRKPKTGEEAVVSARRVVVFKASANFKQLMNETVSSSRVDDAAAADHPASPVVVDA